MFLRHGILLLFLSCALTSGRAAGQQIAIAPSPGNGPLDLTPKLGMFKDTVIFDADAKSIIRSLESRETVSLPTTSPISFNSGTVWLSAVLENPFDHEIPLVLVSEFPVVEMTLVTASGPNRGAIQHTGAAFNNEAYPSSSLPAFSIRLSPGRTQFYLGIAPHDHPFIEALRLWHADAYQRYHSNRVLFLCAIFSAILAVLLISLVHAFAMRQLLYLWHVGTGICFLVLAVVISGLSSYLPGKLSYAADATWIVWTAGSFGCLAMMINKYFHLSRHRLPFTFHFNRVYFFGSLLILPFYAYAPKKISFLIIELGMLLTLNSIVAAARSQRTDRQIALIYLLSCAPVLLSEMPFCAGIMGLIPSNVVYSSILLCGFSVSIFLLSFALAINITSIERAHANLRRSLAGVVSDQQIDTTLTLGVDLLRKPTLQKITVMYIEIIDYGPTLRSLQARDTFLCARKVIADLNAIVYRHGGITDRTLGQRIMCFFGYELTGQPKKNHEDTALLCALDIHDFAVGKILENEPGAHIFPIRIGINTASVVIGNMGTDGRFDVTLSGDGVLLADRLQNACEPFKVIMGTATFAGLSPENAKSLRINKIMIPVTIDQELTEGYEYNPFADRKEILSKARAIIWQANQQRQSHPRYGAMEPIIFETAYGPMNLINFSIGGLCLGSTIMLGRGVRIELKFGGPIPHAQDYLFNPVTAEIMWGMQSEQGTYRLGMRLIGLNLREREQIFALMHQGLNDVASPARFSAG